MRSIFLASAILVLASAQLSAQVYMTRTGKINFDATSKSSPEKIEAKNNEVACVLDTRTSDLRFQVLVKGFKFEKTLMEEHFNENYMESGKYPKAEFKGTIANAKDVNCSKDGTYSATVSGKLTIHGATNDVTVPGTITVKGSTLVLSAKFSVKLEDYKISVPSLVADKLAKVATVTVDADLSKK